MIKQPCQTTNELNINLDQFTVPGVDIDLVNGTILTPSVDLVKFMCEAKGITDATLGALLGSSCRDDKLKALASEVVAEMYTQYVHEALKKTVVVIGTAGADAPYTVGHSVPH